MKITRLFICIIFMTIFSLSTAFSANKLKEVYKLQNGLVVHLTSECNLENLYYKDKLTLITPKRSKTVIFNSEGRKIVDIKYFDINSDNKKDFLIQLDPGGNGGFTEFAILINKNNSFKNIWNSEPLRKASAKITNIKGARVLISSLKATNNGYVVNSNIYKVIGENVILQ